MENQKQEVWMPIPGYEGKYELSNLNNVKSLYFGKERILKQGFYKGYYRVHLCLNDVRQKLGIHQIVAMCHLGHIPKGRFIVVDHINEIKTDNRIENLQIITQRENVNKSIEKGSSKYTGVSWDNRSNKWKSRIVIDRKRICLGVFYTEIEASKYYENALKNHLSGLPIDVKRKVNLSKYKGVCWNKQSNKWMAMGWLNGKSKYLGIFKTELEAYNRHQQYINENI